MLRLFFSKIALLFFFLNCLGACTTHLGQAPESRFVFLDGSSKKTPDFRGELLLVNFWATSCVSCVAEMPDLAQLHQQYQARGLRIIAVAMQYDPPTFVINFAQQRQLPFLVAIDNTGAIAQSWGPIHATPTSFLVNRKGEIVKRIVGPIDAAQIQAEINRLL